MSILPRLNERQRAVIEILSVAWEPLTRTEISNSLNLLGHRARGGRFSAGTIAPTLRQLQSLDLIVEEGRFGCRHRIAEEVIRGLTRVKLERLADVIRRTAPLKERYHRDWRTNEFSYGPQYRDKLQAEREMRLALARNEAEEALELARSPFTRDRPLARLWDELPDQEWAAELPPPLGAVMMAEVCDGALATGEPCAEAFALLERLMEASSPAEVGLARARQLVVRGSLETAERALAERTDSAGRSLHALVALARGDASVAAARWVASNKALRKETGKRKVHPPLPDGLFFAVALLAAGRVPPARAVLNIIHEDSDASSNGVFELAKACNRVESGTVSKESDGYDWDMYGPLALLAAGLGTRWSQTPLSKRRKKILQEWIAVCRTAEYTWLAGELEAVAASTPERRQPPPLRALVVPRPQWEITLESLAALVRPEASVGEPLGDERMAWRISPQGWVEPRLQKRRKGGGWTGGRKVALQRLIGGGELSFLTRQDRLVCETIEVEHIPGYYGGDTTIEFDTPRALEALVDHPLLFDPEGQPIELAAGEVRLALTRSSKGLRLKIEPDLDDDGWRLEWSGRRGTIYRATPKQRALKRTLGSGLRAPQSAEARMRAAAEALAPIVQVQIAGSAAGAAAAEPGDPTPWFTLAPTEDGLSFELRVRPLGEAGPAFPPGTGKPLLLVTLSGAPRRAQRDLNQETSQAASALAACPGLDDAMVGSAERRCELPLVLALTALQQLEALGEQVRLRWSRAEPWSVTPDLGGGALSLQIKGRGGGFALSGALRLGEDELELGTLCDLLADSPSRFVRIAPGRFVALTEAFRLRLEALLRAAPGMRLPGYAAPLLEELTEEAAQVRATRAWTAMLARIRSAAETQPEVPRTLRAELRAYQGEGFRWLARLAAWGAGACLADDMGLGKTVQALALTLRRGGGGPALVVAPTSVCGTWLTEARRFAPTLRAVRFGPGDRAATLAALGPMSLLVCSYGLLVTEREALTEFEWDTVILDEAQAIKNPRTRRHQAAVALKADFRMVTTGTPIENHLGELWSLMRFLNPGLLGTQKRFRETYADPIERDRDPRARAALRRLLRPFILRRRKSQVLHELPPRTDVVLPVVLDAREAAQYEALRQAALARAREGGAMQILAEITRLRRACCHPRLVDPDTTLPGAKLQAFRELVAQLREAGHKALVFSQFTAHLAILRDWLDAEEIPYQYLDGSTTTRARERAVQAFQSGEGDLFLISLRAGGFGLNLTAADYVLHMDPWWNPAVEDQASDRAHRIGQTRPVTVYRLVTQGTIEERVLQLHAEKRALARRVLEGAEQAARITAEEWLSLLETPGG